MSDYNYDVFSSNEYDFDSRTGPVVGEKAPNFLVATTKGEKKALLDFEGEFLVLEMGSLTCPLFQSRRKKMEALDGFGKRVTNAVLYVREAHPGENIPQHKDFESKQACAQRLKTEDGETRSVLVDYFSGAVHNAYGGMPNTVFIIDRDGYVVFRAEWNNSTATRKALIALLNGQSYRVKSFFQPGSPVVPIRTLRRAGKGSVKDFLRSFPILLWRNLIKRNLRLLLNLSEPVSKNTPC